MFKFSLLLTPALALRTETLFNDNWLFHLGDLPFQPPTAASASLFPIDISGTFVHSLADSPSGNVSAAACAAACAADFACQAWQYCPKLLSPTTCAASPAAAPCAFPQTLNDLQCSGLRSASAASEAECASACCSDSSCQVYQWCGASGECSSQGRNACWVGSLAGGCSPVQGWLSGSRNGTQGPACQTGLLADYGPGNWQTAGAGGWVGAARLAPPALPLQTSGPASEGYNDSAFERVQLPFDYLARLAPTNVNATPHQDEHGSIPFSNAWLRRSFSLPADTAAARLYFDGAYRSAYVFLNGALAAQHEEGYTGFSVWLHNVSGAPLRLGSGASNVIAVYLAATIYTYELWGYEGAGITRDVTLVTHTSPLTIAPWGVVAGAEVAGEVAAPSGRDGPLYADALVSPSVDVAFEGAAGASNSSPPFTLTATVLAPDGSAVGASSTPAMVLPAGGWARLQPPPILLPNASLWSPAASPTAPRRPLYTLVTSLQLAGSSSSSSSAPEDSVSTTFGIRRVVFDATAGLTVNGFPTKLRGLSMHQDFAGTGTFVPPSIQAYRLQRTLELGANAFRTAHNPVDSRLLDEADARGVMVWEENRFLRGFEQYVQDAGDMVARDRNHPAIFLWSLCNENGCGETAGYEGGAAGELPGASLAARFMAHLKTLDATRPITANGHNTLGQQGSILYALDVMGLTYDQGALDAMHAARPLVPLLNGESCSCQSDRADQDTAGVIACSSQCWAPADARVWDAGAFVWSGTDYRGETGWPNVVSFYGVLDLCGFNKPAADFYTVWWGAAAGWEGAGTAVAASPAWAPGVTAITALASAPNASLTLAINGVQVGQPQPTTHLGWATWQGLSYAPGNYTVTLTSNSQGSQPAAVLGSYLSRSPGPPVALRLSLDWGGSGPGGALLGGRRDAALVRVAVVDSSGVVVVGASHSVQYSVAGPGELIGLGNGGHQNHIPGQGSSSMPVYSGLGRAVLRGLQATGQPLRLSVSAQGLAGDELDIEVV